MKRLLLIVSTFMLAALIGCDDAPVTVQPEPVPETATDDDAPERNAPAPPNDDA